MHFVFPIRSISLTRWYSHGLAELPSLKKVVTQNNAPLQAGKIIRRPFDHDSEVSVGQRLRQLATFGVRMI